MPGSISSQGCSGRSDLALWSGHRWKSIGEAARLAGAAHSQRSLQTEEERMKSWRIAAVLLVALSLALAAGCARTREVPNVIGMPYDLSLIHI